MQKIWLAVLIAFFALFGSSFAQGLGPNISGTFYADDVQDHQGKITIDPGSHTILRFYDEVTFAFSRRSDVLKAINKGTDVVLYAMSEKIDTDLSVLVDNKWHFFAVKITKGSGLHFYEIKKREETKPQVQAATSSSNPSSSSTPNPASSLVSPDWLKFSITPISNSSQEIRISYSIENTGSKRVVVDAKNLRVLREGQALEFTVENNGKLILEPGAVLVGILRIKAAPGAVKLQWSLREMGSYSAFVLEEELK